MQSALQFILGPLLLLDYLDRNRDCGREAGAGAGYFDRVTAEGGRALRGYHRENVGRCTRCNCYSGGAEGQEWPFAALGRDTGVERDGAGEPVSAVDGDSGYVGATLSDE